MAMPNNVKVNKIEAWEDQKGILHRQHYSAVEAEVIRALEKLPQPTASQPIIPWLIANRRDIAELLRFLNDAEIVDAAPIDVIGAVDVTGAVRRVRPVPVFTE